MKVYCGQTYVVDTRGDGARVLRYCNLDHGHDGPHGMFLSSQQQPEGEFPERLTKALRQQQERRDRIGFYRLVALFVLVLFVGLTLGAFLW